MTFRIGDTEIGANNPCRFVAEISNNHNGNFGRAKDLIYAAKQSGADFVKFQCYTPDELVALRGDGPAPEPWGSQGFTMRALYEKAQTPLEWFPGLAAHCEAVGIPWFSSVFGDESIRVLRLLNCAAYKIARLDNQNLRLATLARMAGKPVIVSQSLGQSLPTAALIPAHTLYCPPEYPQTSFSFDRELFDDCDGFSFHGTDPLPCAVAATLGAKLIEAHFQLDDEPSELEANVSLTASQFKRMVEDVRRVEGMLA